MEQNNNLENLKNESTHGGKREGAGRAKGTKNKNTKEDDIVKEEFRSRVLKSIDSLINSQMNLAHGCQILFKIHSYEDKSGKRIKEKPEIVTSQEEIESYLAGDYDDEEDDYYFITTKQPDNKAIDSLIDRIWGKATQAIEGKLNIKLTAEDLMELNIKRKRDENSERDIDND